LSLIRRLTHFKTGVGACGEKNEQFLKKEEVERGVLWTGGRKKGKSTVEWILQKLWDGLGECGK